ncbi:prepilin peptidase [Demequina litorisediminis]|uniref:prepilin peptidase n=1 Tax=Demequina litorisediminis TaxID=1849022 RepID=UPI0024E114D8|nr:A24 family peptidase [Demequina litorisediminis]
MVISRVPAGESVAHPPSACPRCGHAIRFRHNVPVLGWLVLGGRCYDCHEPISVRYPLIEALTGAVFGALAAWLGVTWDLGLALIVAFFTIVLSAIDLEVRRLPDAVVVPFSAMVAVYLVVWTGVDGDWSRLLHALLGAAILGAFYFGAWFIYPRGMGFGDVKLAPVLGAVLAWYGWAELIVGGFAAFVWGALVGVTVMAITRKGRKPSDPFRAVDVRRGLDRATVRNRDLRELFALGGAVKTSYRERSCMPIGVKTAVQRGH